MRGWQFYPPGAPDFTSGFHRGSCSPVIFVSLFHAIVIFGVLFPIIFSFDCSSWLITWYRYIEHHYAKADSKS